MHLVARCLAMALICFAPVSALSQSLDLDARASLLSPWELIQLVETGERLLIVDVRSEAEHSVSHLAGARRIDPESVVQQVVADLRKKVERVRVVFYCTVGARSQVFADGVLHDLVEAGAGQVNSLGGGIIAWSNARLPLVSKSGMTRFVHPHDGETAKTLEQQDVVRFAR